MQTYYRHYTIHALIALISGEDAILITKYKEGNEDAFAQLVKKHIDHVYAFSLRLTGDQSMAEDVTQQTFVNAWKRLTSFDTDRRFTTWLLAIAHDAAIDYLRKKRNVPLSYFDTAFGGTCLQEQNHLTNCAVIFSHGEECKFGMRGKTFIAVQKSRRQVGQVREDLLLVSSPD